MSISVIGIRKKDGRWDKMMSAKLACEAAGLDYPDALKEYFGSAIVVVAPSSDGIEVLKCEPERIYLPMAVLATGNIAVPLELISNGLGTTNVRVQRLDVRRRRRRRSPQDVFQNPNATDNW